MRVGGIRIGSYNEFTMSVQYWIYDFFYDAVPYVIPVGDSRKINYKMNKNGERYDENRDLRTDLSHKYISRFEL